MSGKICIGNLPIDVDEQELTAMLEQSTTVHWIQIVRDPETGLTRGVAVADVDSPAEAAAGLQGRELDGKRLAAVELKEEREPHHISYGRRRYPAGDKRLHHL